MNTRKRKCDTCHVGKRRKIPKKCVLFLYFILKNPDFKRDFFPHKKKKKEFQTRQIVEQVRFSLIKMSDSNTTDARRFQMMNGPAHTTAAGTRSSPGCHLSMCSQTCRLSWAWSTCICSHSSCWHKKDDFRLSFEQNPIRVCLRCDGQRAVKWKKSPTLLCWAGGEQIVLKPPPNFYLRLSLKGFADPPLQHYPPSKTITAEVCSFWRAGNNLHLIPI